MNKNIEEIICELGSGKACVDFAGGRRSFTKKLKEIIADVPVYSLELQKSEGLRYPLLFDSIEEFEEYCLNDDVGDTVLRCDLCGRFVGNFGYYRDNEENMIYESFECLVESFNRRFGKGNWTTLMNNLDFKIHVKVDENRVDEYEDLVKKDDVYWREYDLAYETFSNPLEDIGFEPIIEPDEILL